jgi:hypothetical protein
MKSKKLKLLGITLMTPFTVFASGQYVLPALLIDLILFILIISLIFRLKITWIGKLILFLMYFASMYLLFNLIDQVNYLENLSLINFGSAVLPTTTVFLAYQLIKGKFKKLDN